MYICLHTIGKVYLPLGSIVQKFNNINATDQKKTGNWRARSLLLLNAKTFTSTKNKTWDGRMGETVELDRRISNFPVS